MSLYVLDTDTLTLLSHGHAQVLAHYAAQPPGQVSISLLTVDEQLSGWYAQVRKARDPIKLARAFDGLLRVVELIKRFPVLAFPLAATQRYFVLRKQLPRLGRKDLAIVAIVLDHGATLVTRNTRDFQQIPGLLLADWSQP